MTEGLINTPEQVLNLCRISNIAMNHFRLLTQRAYIGCGFFETVQFDIGDDEIGPTNWRNQ